MATRIRTILDRGLGRIRAFLAWSVRSYVLFAVIGLVIGLALAPIAIQYSAQPDGKVAVVPVDGSITGQQATAYASQMAQARSDADAVVIVANSGGGSASASEDMYIQTKRTSEQMPVVTTVSAAAASGAYYTIAPSDHIFAKPASIIGSVGVRAPTPTDLSPQSREGTTGPDKISSFGGDRQFFHALETLKRAFVGAVMTHREDRLVISENEVSTARTWTGASAVEVGLADDIGDRQAAVALAAEEANLDNPEVEVLTPERESRFMLRSTYLASTAEQRQYTGGEEFVSSEPAGVPTFLMVPGGVVGESSRPIVSAGQATEFTAETDAEPGTSVEIRESDEAPSGNQTATTADEGTDSVERGDVSGDRTQSDSITALPPGATLAVRGESV